MSTLGILKTRIRNDIFREDLDTQIVESIQDAIRTYGRRRFYFNEVRAKDFLTVPGQVWYGEDVTGVAVQIDDALFVRSDADVTQIRRTDVTDFEFLTDASASRGEPFQYAYYGRQIGLYPIPDKVYTIRLNGLFRLNGPQSEDETGNAWMTEAFELIRCRAKAYLFAHHMQDPQMANVYSSMELDELANIRAETTRRVSYDGFRKTSF